MCKKLDFKQLIIRINLKGCKLSQIGNQKISSVGKKCLNIHKPFTKRG